MNTKHKISNSDIRNRQISPRLTGLYCSEIFQGGQRQYTLYICSICQYNVLLRGKLQHGDHDNNIPDKVLSLRI